MTSGHETTGSSNNRTVRSGLVSALPYLSRPVSERQVLALLKPDLVHSGAIRVRLSDGSVTDAEAFRYGFAPWLGLHAGGTRFEPEVTAAKVEELSLGMYGKYAVVDLPYAAVKTGVSMSLKGLPEEDETAVLTEFVRLMDPVLGPFKGRVGPDMGLTERHMDVIVDVYRRIHDITRDRDPHAWDAARLIATGKSVGEGGIPARTPSTGYGLAVAMLDVVQRHGVRLRTVAVDGWGAVAQHLAAYLVEQGVTVVAVRNRSAGAFHNGEGIDVLGLARHTAREGSSALGDFPGLERIPDPEDLLAMEVDGLALCSAGGVVHEGNAVRIQAKVIGEGANFPVTPEADPVLDEKGVAVAPFVLASSGGIIGSHCERLANLGREMPEERVFFEVDRRIRAASSLVHGEAHRLGVSNRVATNVVALTKIVDSAISAGKV